MRLRAVKWLVLLAVPGLFAALLAQSGGAPAPEAAKPTVITFEKNIHPLVEKYCYECHGNGNHKGGIALDKFKSTADVDADHKTWALVLEKVHKQEMPPDDADHQPTLAERDTISDWIDQAIYKYDPANPDPGRITLHRLNRAEYANSIRDLVGVDFQAADVEDFPPDDSGYGFDNIGDVLSLPPMLLQKYLAAADKILDQAIPTEPLVSHKWQVPSRMAEIGFNAIGVHEDGWAELKSLEEDDMTVELPIPAAGEYRVTFLAYGTPTGGYSSAGVGYRPSAVPTDPETPKMSLRLRDTLIKQFAITAADKEHPAEFGGDIEVGVPAGKARFRLVMDRDRGGDNDLIMINGRIGKQQNGLGFVKWLQVEGPLPGALSHYPADKTTASGEGYFTKAGERVLTKAGDVSVKFTVPKGGEYILRVYGYAAAAGPDPARMELRVDGQALQTFDVLAPARLQILPTQRTISSLSLLRPIPQVYEIRTKLTPGEKTFSAAFLNPFEDPDNQNPNLRSRQLTVQSLEVVDLSAPAQPPPMPEQMMQYFTQTITPANKTTQARAILAQFARRAWRRPVEPVELDRLMGLFALADKNGDSFEAGVKLAMKAVLVSSHFLFRDGLEQLAGANTAIVKTAAAKPGAAATESLGVPVDEFTLATRLSYFLWSSTPDDELLDLAEHHQLRAQLPAQVRRMLASPKARALVDNFAAQWLQFRSLPTFEPSKAIATADHFNLDVRTEMQKETETFFEYIMRQDRSVMDFLTADYTFVNEDLANYYGLTGVTGDDFQKVSLKDTPRRGVLTQGSVLLLTSNPTRTSPVKRGKWVLENLLGTPPPPPPPNVPVLDEETQLTGTLRQQMEQHRANPTCASCHARMDPIGFGLENFDAAGAWRTTEGAGTDHETPIDTSGTLVSGENFHGAAELINILADKKKTDFLRCLSSKLLTYALGRGLEYYDRAATDKIILQLDQGGDKFSTLVLSVANSIPFQEMRRAEPVAPDAAPKPADKVAGN